ncbi:cell division control protein 14, SIN component-domain-containing protein [Roridomyces roridus]|uniref:Cell division control protein 14, SIN component-domain-containing protein n=1 Tax=Roridomyces roridus TaxID=1738132 RepID=A0AAD7BGG7_9AGAR|nr:cell division control protein 14, SIN component-domain-containing protein [Roridomyces roridus]
MAGTLQALRESLQDALDDLSSPRTSNEVKSSALQRLEKTLARACVSTSSTSTEVLDHFLALQYTFECNVPARILGWIAGVTPRLENAPGEPEDADLGTLSTQLTLALSIIQGIALIHPASKVYLGRKYALEILLDLFLAARHLSNPTAATPGKSNGTSPLPPLASSVLDTLLCILVDASPALRAFEACQGVHAVVKILKRAATPREVRMKCLEFLYFYLLDETTPTPLSTPTAALPNPLAEIPTAPNTPHGGPTRKKTAFVGVGNGTPLRPSPSSRYGSSTFEFASSSFASTSSSTSMTSSPFSCKGSRSTSGSSTSSESASGTSFSSFSSTESNAGSTPTATPKSTFVGPRKQPPPGLGTPLKAQKPQSKALLMLKKEVDFVPLSPKKVVVEGEKAKVQTPGRALGNGNGHGHVRTRSRLVLSDEGESEDAYAPGVEDEEGKCKTTEEKKRLLGTMLGNVEALVEGVRKAGIWGLG